MFSFENMEKIKENVWKMEKFGKYYSVKKYDSISTIVKVKHIHETLNGIGFPHILPVISTDDPLLLIQPWLENARSVKFNKRADRIDSLEALHALHGTTIRVGWSASNYLHHYQIIKKWEDRVIRFRLIAEACEKYIGKQSVNEILFYAVHALQVIKKRIHDESENTLLHGDVVHHNILRDENGVIRFIDFDLACTGAPGTEIVLWMHRVLPHINYELDFLMNEQPSLHSLPYTSKILLLYPNEILREWLYFFSLTPSGREKQAKNLIYFTHSALSKWPKLWYDVERMKN
jgi:serine/threonine protein kinase